MWNLVRHENILYGLIRFLYKLFLCHEITSFRKNTSSEMAKFSETSLTHFTQCSISIQKNPFLYLWFSDVFEGYVNRTLD